jgi:hypothetical protein
MSAAEKPAEQGASAQQRPKHIGEWFWRFLALVMLATVGWIVWIIYQINPQPLITNAAFEAAAKARAASQDAKGVITPAVAEAPKPAAEPPKAEPKEPPVNVERLRLADSIETPIPERGKKK